MKICIFTHTFPLFPGDNSAPFMGELTEALTDKNEVVVLTPYNSNIKKNIKRPYKLVTYKYIYPDSLHILGYSKTLSDDKRLSILGLLLSPFLYFFGFLALLKLVKKEKIDVISSHWVVPSGFISALVSFFTKVPYTTTIPGSDVYMGTRNFFFRFLVGVGSMRANWVISDSKHYIAQLKDLGFKPKNISIIRYGVNSQKFKSTNKDKNLLKEFGITKENIVIMSLGRFVAKKGFIYLIKAAPQIINNIKNVVFLLVGDGDQRENIKAKIEELEIENKFILPGMISFSDLVKYYNLADIFVMPSIKDEKGNIDASPVSMMEAMICGIPTVVTPYAGGKEIISQGKTGYIVPPNDFRAISKSVIKLLRKSKKTKDIKRLVRSEAIKNFSVVSASKNYQEIFNEIINEK